MLVFSASSFAAFSITAITLAVTSAVVAVVALFVQKWRMERQVAAFPSFPNKHWLFGHLLMATSDEKANVWIGKTVDAAVDVSVFWVGPFNPFVSVFHPETVKAILKTSEPKSDSMFRFVRPWIGDGLLLSSGKKWGRNRRLLTPGFHFDILKPYTGIFQESADILVEKWQTICGREKRSLEMFNHMSLLMLDSLLKCIFSVESNCQILEDHPYIKGIHEIAILIADRFRFPPFHFDAIYNLSPSGRRFQRAIESVHNYAHGIVAQRKQALAEAAASGNKVRQRKYVDFLDILLTAKDADGKGLTDQEIYDEVDTFMFEGHDTTASGISWFLYNMARFPEFQQKCREEIDTLLADREQTNLEWDDLGNLPYLTQCLKETLRFHAPVFNITRTLTQSLTFPDGREVPKGTSVAVVISGLHHNGAVWDDPETFDPERFSPERAKLIPPYAFVPFSAGPRNCIGQHFAMNEIKVIAAKILRNFHLSLDESIPVLRKSAVVLRSEHGINLNVVPRKH